MTRSAREIVTEVPDGGICAVTVSIPPDPAEVIVWAADGGWHVPSLSAAISGASGPSTMIVGVHGQPDDDGRLKEYVPGIDPACFAAHERFFVDDARRWVASRFGITVPAERTADADVAMVERDGEHGGAFWGEELPRMVAWAFAS